MNVQSIDLGDELREGIQSGLALAPVIFRSPVVREPLDRRELYSLGCICNRFSFRPLCRVDAPAQIGKLRVRKIHAKRTNRILVGCLVAGSCSSGLGHGVSFGGCLGLVVVWGGEHDKRAKTSTQM